MTRVVSKTLPVAPSGSLEICSTIFSCMIWISESTTLRAGILNRLLYFVKKQTLPHFFMSDLNLFRGIPEKYLTYMRTPLERLVSNET